jgi:hypothetical protein
VHTEKEYGDVEPAARGAGWILGGYKCSFTLIDNLLSCLKRDYIMYYV